MDPVTRYAPSGDVRIAYQVLGEGPPDLVMVPGLTSHLEVQWQWPIYRRFVVALARRCRLIRFDKRGTGMSDPVAEPPDLEQRQADLLAVMDAAGSRRAVLLGYSEGGPISIRTAATAPDRVVGLVLYGTSARRPPPWAVAQLRRVVDRWGEGHSTDLFAPGLGPDGRRTLGTLERMAASPAMARAVVDALARVNVIGLLPEVRVPTLVVHRRGDFVPIRDARYTARRISGARLVELEGEQHMPWLGDWRSVVDAVGGFLSELGGAAPRPGRRSAGEPTQPGWAGLTAAEVAVVEVVAEGLSNPEAAARLFLSRKTVETHLKHVYSKLGIRSRAELAALYAARRSAEIT